MGHFTTISTLESLKLRLHDPNIALHSSLSISIISKPTRIQDIKALELNLFTLSINGGV